MAHTGIFATKAEIDIKVGQNVDATGYTEAAINAACLQAESFINCVSRHNWSDDFDDLNADVKYILAEAEACWVAIDFILWDMSVFTSRIEAEDMINLLWQKFWRCIDLLGNQQVVTFMVDA